jgi:hypothetical protein
MPPVNPPKSTGPVELKLGMLLAVELVFESDVNGVEELDEGAAGMLAVFDGGFEGAAFDCELVVLKLLEEVVVVEVV